MPFDSKRIVNRETGGFIALVVLALALLAGPGHAARKSHDGTVTGTVTAMANGEAVAGAEVTLTGPGGETETGATDKRGRFKIKVPAGDYVIKITGGELAPFEAKLAVQPGVSQKVDVEMLDAAAGRRSQAAKLFNAGLAAYRAGDRATAKESLAAAAEADPTLVEPHRVLARIHSEETAWAEAARAAEAALAISPEDNQALRFAYDAYRQLKDPRAVEVRSKLAADAGLVGTLAKHAFNEGALAGERGDSALAAERFREALDLDASLAAAHFALASLHFQADRYDDALAGARKGLEIEPANAPGRRLVFISLEGKGDAEAAAEALDAYAEVDVDAAVGILYNRGEIGFLNGDFEPAVKALNRLLAYQPDHPHAHRLLGLMAASNDAAAARRYLGRFLELAPDDPEAATVREVLAEL